MTSLTSLRARQIWDRPTGDRARAGAHSRTGAGIPWWWVVLIAVCVIINTLMIVWAVTRPPL
ncbi:MAG TPA: hypothetical protein VES60_03190 [Nakamurella sp.]|nr:hypothetical protein [Nakamurella sp.]